MKNINRTALFVGSVFAIVDALCALFFAFATQPFLSFLGYVTHIKLIGVAIESSVTLSSFLGGIIGTFILGYVLTLLFAWLHQRICCVEK